MSTVVAVSDFDPKSLPTFDLSDLSSIGWKKVTANKNGEVAVAVKVQAPLAGKTAKVTLVHRYEDVIPTSGIPFTVTSAP